MRFHIHHSLQYSYERPVFLEPLTVRLSPRQDVTQRLREHSLRVSEAATGSARVVEPDGTDAVVLWFNDERDRLVIAVDSVVETLRLNPFDWIVTHEGTRRLPASYSSGESASLRPTLEGCSSAIVATWAQGLSETVEGSTTAFLMRLADEIHHGFHHVGRADGAPFTAEATLLGRSGACRDTAMLYVEACRSQGLAARFVSGYSIHHPPEVTEQELHAWAEVYVPGGGWRGYDPSLGLAVADGHVALAAAPCHELAAPVSGTYRGTRVASQMSYVVRLSATQDDGTPLEEDGEHREDGTSDPQPH